MSKKCYWIIKVEPFYPLSTYHFYCPKCQYQIKYVLHWDNVILPQPKYCPHCGKRLYIKEETFR